MELINQYKALIKDFKDLNLQDFAAILEQKNPISRSGGVRIMLENIQALLEQERGMNYPELDGEQKVRDIKVKINEFQDYINNHAHWDHCDVRLGACRLAGAYFI